MTNQEIFDLAISKGAEALEDGTIILPTGRKANKNPQGKSPYLTVSLNISYGKFKNFKAHQFVIYYFTRDTRVFNRDWDVHHKDEDKRNNSIDNLEFVPVSSHRSSHSKGKTPASTIITPEQAKEIKALWNDRRNNKLNQFDLGRMFGVHNSTISKIVTGVNYAGIT